MTKKISRKITIKKRSVGRDHVVGKLEVHKQFESKFLEIKRDVLVWFPSSYKQKKNQQKRYPVVYMHDGQNLFEPKTSFAGMDWRVDETVTKLIRRNELKDLIVIGINNTKDRLKEYDWTEEGENYLKFITEELKPFIDLNYRTQSGRESTAIMGSSMGGLISFYAAWFYPEIFSMAGCMSSSFYYNDEAVLKIVREYEGEKKPIRFYIDHGEDGLLRGQKMFCLLSQKGYVIGTDIDYYYARGAEHNEREWANRLERPLKFFFAK